MQVAKSMLILKLPSPPIIINPALSITPTAVLLSTAHNSILVLTKKIFMRQSMTARIKFFRKSKRKKRRSKLYTKGALKSLRTWCEECSSGRNDYRQEISFLPSGKIFFITKIPFSSLASVIIILFLSRKKYDRGHSKKARNLL